MLWTAGWKRMAWFTFQSWPHSGSALSLVLLTLLDHTTSLFGDDATCEAVYPLLAPPSTSAKLLMAQVSLPWAAVLVMSSNHHLGKV